MTYILLALLLGFPFQKHTLLDCMYFIQPKAHIPLG